MRFRRTISDNTAIYHCMSRTVNGEAWFGKREMEVLRKMIAQVADFSGVDVLTYCIMNNHFHVLVRVTPTPALDDAELIRRYSVLYPKSTVYQSLTAKDLERVFATNDSRAKELRTSLLARMGDVSQFMKTLKQRFSMWFNKHHDRFGPVWSDRFKSVLVEGRGFALQTMAAYIDLNPVRAGLVSDPKDYRFCGYAEAVAGNEKAISGIIEIAPDFQKPTGPAAMQSYRQLLFGKGLGAATRAAHISRRDALRVLENENGVLPIATLLRCRIRYFTEGAVLGSTEFIQSHLEAWQTALHRKRAPKVHPIPGNAENLACINSGRGAAFS